MKAGTATTIIGGIATQLLAILCWYGFYHWLDVDVLKLWAKLILPLGAFVLGLVGGWGFYVAGRRVRRPSTPWLALGAVAIAVVTVMLIRFLGYWSAEVDGIPLHRTMSFLAYLRATLGHARIEFSPGGTVNVGATGYIMELFQTAAYAAASYVFTARLPPAIWCERCHVPMHDSLWDKLRFDEKRVFEARRQSMPTDPAARLVALRAMNSETSAPGVGAVDWYYRLAECPSCSAAAVAETVRLYTGQYWAPQRALARVGRFDRAYPIPARSMPDPMPPAGPAIRTFGRRTTI